MRALDKAVAGARRGGRTNNPSEKPVGEGRLDALIQRKRREPGIVNNTSLPVRGTTDAYGNPFAGLEADRLQDSLLSDSALFHEQNRPGYMDNSVGQNGKIRSIPNDVKLTKENIVGAVVAGGNIEDNSIGDGKISGRLQKIDVPGLSDNRAADAGTAVDLAAYKDYKTNASADISKAKTDASDALTKVGNKASKSDLAALARRVKKLEGNRK